MLDPLRSSIGARRAGRAIGPGPSIGIVAAWLVVAAAAGRAGAQDGPLLPDSDPSAGVRIEGPLLSARPQDPAMPPLPTGSSPFGPVAPGTPTPDLSDAAGVGPEPIPVQQPILTVPPALPPLPPPPPGAALLPDSAYEPNRSTEIRKPVASSGPISRFIRDGILWGDEPYQYITLPSTLLWKVPLANQREPRFFGKFTNLNHKSYIDTAIGGQVGLGRIAPRGHDDEGLQLDVFAAVFTRFNPRRFLTSADYRAGVPLTYRKGKWSTKLSYEHTSTHLGDEYIQAYHQRQVALVLDEVVLGVSRYFGDHVRLYGQYGYAFNTAKETNANQRNRFDLGLSYSNYADTGPVGRPFLAFDMDLRQYQGYRPNDTFQAGWQWVQHGRSARIAVEVYNGKSPYGQFYKNDEHWVALAGYYDF